MAMAAALFLASPAAAQSPAAGLPLDDQVEMCGACHGADGNSEIPEFPSLAGQPELFIVNQMIFFRERLRRNEVMMPQAEGLTDAEIQDLAAHYAGLPAKYEAGDPDTDSVERGHELSRKLRCGTCHLSDYSGRQQIPRLAGQREDYTALALRAYRDRTRGAADTTMIDIMRGVSDEDIEAMAHYLATRPH